MDLLLLVSLTCLLGILVWVMMDKVVKPLLKKVDPYSPSHGGQLVAEVLHAANVRHIFTLVGGHISPILVACENLGIRVVDTRHEVNAVFAADAVARLGGGIGVVAVTAGPGLTNTVTAIKNAQMAESPVLLLGGAAASLLKGRGALQDIDQMSLFKPICKFVATIKRVADIVPTLKRAMQMAQSGTPGPVFVEFPIDTLYKYAIVEKEITGSSSSSKSIAQFFVNLYLKFYLHSLFAGAWERVDPAPLNVRQPMSSLTNINLIVNILNEAKKPVIVLGSQATLPPVPASSLRACLERLGIPCFLGGMSRGLLGRDSPIHMRQRRRDALKEADVVLLLGTVCDFRLGYGRVLSRKSKVIAVNRNKEQLFKNSDMFWKPALAVQADAASTLISVTQRLDDKFRVDAEWVATLKGRDAEKEKANSVKAQNIFASSSLPAALLNPVALLHRLEDVLPENAILVADGGDFVGTAAYVLRPREPLTWLDPGAFGTLGVGAGFALGAKLVRPDAEVWIIYGDGSLGYSLIEYDTFKRFKTPVIALVGNDACWSQIAREQVPMLGSDTACALEYTPYHQAVEGLGAKGFVLGDAQGGKVDEEEGEKEVRRVLEEARKECGGGTSVLINALIGKSDFRAGSISV